MLISYIFSFVLIFLLHRKEINLLSDILLKCENFQFLKIFFIKWKNKIEKNQHNNIEKIMVPLNQFFLILKINGERIMYD